MIIILTIILLMATIVGVAYLVKPDYVKNKWAIVLNWLTTIKAIVKTYIKQWSTWLGGILSTIALLWPTIEQSIPGIIDNLMATHPEYTNAARGIVGIVGLAFTLWNQDKNKSE